MPKVDRLVLFFVVIVGYTAVMNIILFRLLKEGENVSTQDLKSKLKGFIRRHSHNGAQNDNEPIGDVKNRKQPKMQSGSAQGQNHKIQRV